MDKFVKLVQWPIDTTTYTNPPQSLADLSACPLPKYQEINEEKPGGKLLAALVDGQERGWINHDECHWFLLLDCEKSGSSIASLVYNIPQQQFEVFVFLSRWNIDFGSGAKIRGVCCFLCLWLLPCRIIRILTHSLLFHSPDLFELLSIGRLLMFKLLLITYSQCFASSLFALYRVSLSWVFW